MKNLDFIIRESELAATLRITREELDKQISFLDCNDNQWMWKEGCHFIYINRKLNERAFSKDGTCTLVDYINKDKPRSIWQNAKKLIKELFFKQSENIKDALVNQKILENRSSLIVNCGRRYLSKKDVANIFGTNNKYIDKAFEAIRISDNPLIRDEDFNDFNEIRYYSFSGIFKLSYYFTNTLTSKKRRDWCRRVSIVGEGKSFPLIIDTESMTKKRIDAVKGKAKRRDKHQCQITGRKRDKYDSMDMDAHHIYDVNSYSYLADCEDNLITLCQEIHAHFHTWNGGYGVSCNASKLINFVHQFYPKNFNVVERLLKVQQMFD